MIPKRQAYASLTFLISLIGLGLYCPGQAFEPPADSAGICNLLFQFGNSYSRNQDFYQAADLYRKAIPYSTTPTVRSSLHQNLGCLYHHAGNYEKAAIYLEYAYSLINGDSFLYPDRLAGISISLGSAYFEMGQPEKSLNWLARAEELSPDSNWQWQVRLGVARGNCRFLKGDIRLAALDYREALQLIPDEIPVTPEEIWAIRNLAVCYREMQAPDSALVALDIAISRASLSTDLPLLQLAGLWLEKGKLLVQSGNGEEASAVFRLSEDLLQKLAPGDKGYKYSELLRYLTIAGKQLTSGMFRHRSGADQEEVRLLIRDLNQTAGWGEELASDPALREMMIKDPETQLALYDRLFELTALSGIGDSAICQEIANLMVRSEWFRWIDEPDEWLPEGQDNKVAGYTHHLRCELYGMQKQLLDDPRLTPEGQPDLPVLRMDLRNRLDSLTFSASIPEQVSAKRPQTTSVQEFESHLQEQEALIALHLTDSAVVTLLICPDTCWCDVRIQDPSFRQRISSFRYALATADEGLINENGVWLQEWLVPEPLRRMEGCKRLLVIPGPELTGIPFEALIFSGENTGSLHYLVERYEVVYYTTLTSWLESRREFASGCLRPQTSFRYDFLAFKPNYDGNAGMMALPYAERELHTLGELFNRNGFRTGIKPAVRLEEGELWNDPAGSRIIHLISHGKKDPERTASSGWILQNEGTMGFVKPGCDGNLEIGELQSFRLHTDLIVFSSCGVGGWQAPKWCRVTGFPENLLRAGARHVLFSLWRVADKHTCSLMEDFYRLVLKSLDYPEALRQVKLKMLAQETTLIPTIWAPYILYAR